MLLIKDIQALPARSRRLLLLTMVNNLGAGLVTPFLVVYVHQVNGLPLTVATAAMATVSVGVMLGSLLAGRLTDRHGAEFVVTLYMVVQALGLAGYAAAGQGWHFITAAAVVGLGLGGSAAWNTMLAGSAPSAQHPAIFSLSFTGANVSLGVGGLLGAAVAAGSSHLAFRGLYLADALSCLLVGAAFLRPALLRAAGPAGGRPTAGPGADGTSYAVVLRQPRFLLLLVLGGLLFCVSYAQLESGLPARLTSGLGIGPAALAVLFAVNTGGVLLGQVFLHKQLSAVRPARLVATAAALWAVSWAAIQAAGSVAGGTARFTVLLAALAVFAVGETCFAAGMPTLVNALAPADARGRFNAAYSMAISAGFILGPLTAGAVIGSGGGSGFIAGLSATCLALALAVRAAERYLTAPAQALPEPAGSPA
ncbi:MFS transporter [Kitasatospora sp. NPDC058170]|uniref:MFS transporter n=1 Tax=Kitasatospora sp. NPDC058170 TaxID=3346364 RepID=UPI0036D79A57